MIAFFYNMVVDLKKRGKPYWPLAYKVNKLLLNLFYPWLNWGYHKTGIDRNSPIIVSLTTYPARINTVWITVTSLLRQTMKPCKIILYLAEEQFPDKKLPGSLDRLMEYGLEIVYVEDLKPHKKYFYVMQEYPEHYIVTADDDIFYPEDHLEKLWKGHEKYPDTIVCHWSHRIMPDERKNIAEYNQWEDNCEEVPCLATMAVGCNGVLYPPGCLPARAFNQKKLTELALYTDDLWLKCMEIINDYKTVNCNETILIYYNIVKTKKSGLWQKNTGQAGRNDLVWTRLMEAFPEVKEKLLMELNG
ncbi:MAG: hypothetical protein IJP31_10625 [Lachnospiraceae bacterium]|nr:hypothetical protein [Lachnospiraceae bacterium]